MIISSIVTYKTNHEDLIRLINCASSSTIDRIYVIDNSPTNELEAFVKILSDKVDYIFNNNNLGYGSAHNIALKKSMESDAKYHVVLNPDIYFDEGTIEALESFMNNNSDVGAVMPMIKYPNGNIQHLCKLQPTPFNLIFRRFLPNNVFEQQNARYTLKMSGYNKLMNIPCLSGCFMFIRTSVLKETGLFDDSFFMYCEDFDFYRRIHAKYKTMFYPYVTVIHAHKKESYINKQLLYQHIKSAVRYFNKWGWFFDKGRREANHRIMREIKNNA